MGQLARCRSARNAKPHRSAQGPAAKLGQDGLRFRVRSRSEQYHEGKQNAQTSRRAVARSAFTRRLRKRSRSDRRRVVGIVVTARVTTSKRCRHVLDRMMYNGKPAGLSRGRRRDQSQHDGAARWNRHSGRVSVSALRGVDYLLPAMQYFLTTRAAAASQAAARGRATCVVAHGQRPRVRGG